MQNKRVVLQRIGIVFCLLLVLITACGVEKKSITRVYNALDSVIRNVSDSSVKDSTKIIIDSLSKTSKLTDIKSDSIKIDSNHIDSIKSKRDSITSSDSIKKPIDTIAGRHAKFVDAFPDIIEYESQDSIVMDSNRIAFLFGKSNINYQDKGIEANYMKLTMDSNLVYATYVYDSLGKPMAFPKFKDGGDSYEAKIMKYNFKSGRGLINGVVTQQGEGYVTASIAKKDSNNIMYMQNCMYTTCDKHEHPHFYLALTKAKARPKKDIVTGPSYLVIQDVPLPVGLPFGFFPFSSRYQSGIIMPKYGEESNRGIYLRDGGYYFAINDYVDLAITGDIYSRGSWGVNVRSNYNKRYICNGGFTLGYIVTANGYKDVAGSYSQSKDFRFTWTHSQDAKYSPNSTLSASVNYSTSSYNHNSLNQLYNPMQAGQNTKSSSINFSHNFAGTPWSISAGIDATQTSVDSMVSLSLPNVSWSMNRLYPFRRKKKVGVDRWYEKISISYSGQMTNTINTKEYKLLKSNLIKDWRNGISHSIPISASYKLFDYVDFTLSANYTERWYSYKTEKKYDETTNQIVDERKWGFNRVYNFGTSASLGTTMYGFYKPLSIFGDKVEMIRHRVTPRIGFSYTPDFGSPFFGFYRNLRYLDKNGQQHNLDYSLYSDNVYGGPGRGLSASINFGMDNNLEAKVKVPTDSVPTSKKISLIENFSWSSSYNFAADSFKLSDIATSINLKLPGDININLSGSWDPYVWETQKDAQGNLYGKRVDKIRLFHGKGFGSLRGTGTSFSYDLNAESLKKLWKTITFQNDDKDKNKSDKDKKDKSELSDNQKQSNLGGIDESGANKSFLGKDSDPDLKYDSDGYVEADLPWNLNFSYGISMSRDRYNPEKNGFDYKFNHSLMFSGNIQPTKGWSINFNSSYDFENNKIANLTIGITRDLHCWSLNASAIPIGPYKSYSITIGVKSSLLRDLKWDKHDFARPGGWY